MGGSEEGLDEEGNEKESRTENWKEGSELEGLRGCHGGQTAPSLCTDTVHASTDVLTAWLGCSCSHRAIAGEWGEGGCRSGAQMTLLSSRGEGPAPKDRSCNLTASAAPYQPDPAVEHPLRLALVLPQDSDFFFAFSRSLGISLHLGGVPLSRSMA